MKRLIMLFVALIMFVLNISTFAESSLADNSASSPDIVNAVWQEHEEKFTVFSPYTYYSCDGMERKVETLLEELGAKEVKARATGCYEVDSRLGKNLRVRVKFKTLSIDSNAQGDAVKANLQEVHIRPRHPRTVGLGDCEIIESIQKTLLDNFEHEVVKANRTCFPGQQSLGDVNWKLKVLKATG